MTMQSCKISIAGLTLAITCNHPQLMRLIDHHYAPFASEAAPVLEMKIEWEKPLENPGSVDGYEFTYEQGCLLFSSATYHGEVNVTQGQAWLRLQSANPMMGVEYFLRAAYALMLFDAGGVLLHSAGLVRDERAYLFFGYSGSGKSTVVSLSPNLIVLSDDLVALCPVRGVWHAYATPFWNPTESIPQPYAAPLAGIYRLVQDQRVFLEPISPAQGVAELASSIPIVSADPDRGGLVLARCIQLAQQVGLSRLHFRMDDFFWSVVLGAACLDSA